MQGVIKVLKDDYGFITVEGQKDLFFHATALINGREFDELVEGDMLAFDMEDSDRGPKAVNVERFFANSGYLDWADFIKSTLTPYSYRLPSYFPPDCASAWGEDECGAWFVLRLNKVELRFRWIPRAHYVLLSSENKAERHNISEALRKLIDARGYWLASTTCTQDFWQVVRRQSFIKVLKDGHCRFGGHIGSRYFFHATNLINGIQFDDLVEGDMLCFGLEESYRD